MACVEKLVAAIGRRSERNNPNQFKLALEDLKTAIGMIPTERQDFALTQRDETSAPRPQPSSITICPGATSRHLRSGGLKPSSRTGLRISSEGTGRTC